MKSKSSFWRKTRIRTLFYGAFPLLMGLLHCPDASALMIPLATTQLVDRANCIVEGKVTGLAFHWTDDRSGIVTEVRVEATDVLLGTTNHVTFLYKGGVVGDLEERVSDMPTLANGQHVLVFLRSLAPEEARLDRADALRDRRYTLVGAAQGLYKVEGGRAKKGGFSVVGNPAVIDRELDVSLLKTRIRDRLDELQKKGGAR